MPPFSQAEGENTTEKQVSRFSSAAAQTPSVRLLCVSCAAVPLKRPRVSQEEPV